MNVTAGCSSVRGGRMVQVPTDEIGPCSALAAYIKRAER